MKRWKFMAHISLPVVLLVLLTAAYAEILTLRHGQQRPHQSQRITDLSTRVNQREYIVHDPAAARAHAHVPAGALDEQLDLLDIVLVASVDGALHALNRSSGASLWSMSTPLATDSQTAQVAPLVRTEHPPYDGSLPAEYDGEQEVYIIEPQSGDIYVMPTPSSPLQRLPLSMSQLVELSPYSIWGEDSLKVFTGRKETSLLVVELETGRIKATLNSDECPWDPFEDQAADDAWGDELDLDELEGSTPRRVKTTSTDIFIGRTDYRISIRTRPLEANTPAPPDQKLSFSTYGPNNQDIAYQTLYKRTPDDIYVQPLANGKIMAFHAVGPGLAADADDERRGATAAWVASFKEPIVASFDVLRSPSHAHPFVLLQPRLTLSDLLPHDDLATAAREDRLPNLDAAYVGIVETSGSLYVLSPDRYPLVVFGDTNTFDEQHGYGAEYGVGRAAGRLIDPPPGSGYPHDTDLDSDDRDFPTDIESVTRAMKRKKLREFCRQPGAALKDKRCFTGVRKMEDSRLSRLLDGAATVPVQESLDVVPDLNHPFGQPGDAPPPAGNASLGSTANGRPHADADMREIGDELSKMHPLGAYVLGALTTIIAVVIAWVIQKKTHSGRASSKPALSHVDVPEKVSPDGANGMLNDSSTALPGATTPADAQSRPSTSTSQDAQTPAVESPSGTATPKAGPRKVSFGEALKVTLQDGEDGTDGAAGDGDESDNDTPATPGKRKAVRRRRGKKKPKGLAMNGAGEEDSAAGGDQTSGPTGDSSGSSPDTNGVIHVVSPSAIVVPPPATPTPVVPSLVVSDTILGFGSHGTVVFKGSLQGRAVAVKRLLQDFVTLAAREVTILQESDDHPNVIRYYYQEAHSNFLYIALELCPASLADVVERPDQFREIAVAFDPKRALKQITSGLRHLHTLKIIHRDIKPQNILISNAKKGVGEAAGHRMLISDFGLCKKLEIDQTSFLPTVHGAMAAGTVGWRAPEILRDEVRIDVSGGEESQSSRGSAYGSDAGTPTGRLLKRLTKSVDIFALGCLFYYVLTNGGHPFGDRYEREINILKDTKCLDGLERFGEEGSDAVDLIAHMLSAEAQDRPDTSTCLTHPYFWNPGKRLNFLQDASDRFEIMCRDPRDPLLVELERDAFAVVGNDWNARLDKWFIENLGKYRKYDGKSVQDLMRALRNKKHHYQDLPDNVKRQIGSMPEGFLAYFTRRFPRLFLHVHGVVSSSMLRTESMFRSYFELSDS